MADITRETILGLIDPKLTRKSFSENKLAELLHYMQFVTAGRSFRDEYRLKTEVPYTHHKDAQKAVDDLRKLIRKIIEDHHTMPERYEGERADLTADDIRLEKWIAEAPTFLLREEPGTDWHHVAGRLLLLYRGVFPDAKLSKTGPTMRFMESALSLCGYKDVEPDTIAKLFERKL